MAFKRNKQLRERHVCKWNGGSDPEVADFVSVISQSLYLQSYIYLDYKLEVSIPHTGQTRRQVRKEVRAEAINHSQLSTINRRAGMWAPLAQDEGCCFLQPHEKDCLSFKSTDFSS